MSEIRLGTRKMKNNGQNNPIKPTIKEKIQSMVESGQAGWNGEKLPPHQPLVINNSDRLLSDLVIENRQLSYL